MVQWKWPDPIEIWRYTHFSLKIMGRKDNFQTKKHIIPCYPQQQDQQQGSLHLPHAPPKGLGFFHRLDHLGYPDNDRRRLAMVVKHEPSICLSPTCKRHLNQPGFGTLPFFLASVWKAVKENKWFFGFFAAFFWGIHQN